MNIRRNRSKIRTPRPDGAEAETFARRVLAALTAGGAEHGSRSGASSREASASPSSFPGGSGTVAPRSAPERLSFENFERLEERRQREWLFRRHRPSRAGWNRD